MLFKQRRGVWHTKQYKVGHTIKLVPSILDAKNSYWRYVSF